MHIGSDNFVCNSNAQPCGALRHKDNDPTASILKEETEFDYAFEDNFPDKFLELMIGRYNKLVKFLYILKRKQITKNYNWMKIQIYLYI